MINVLFLTGTLQKYRIPILNLIGENADIILTVAHAGKPLKTESDKFEEIILIENKFFGFTFHSKGFQSFCNSFDVIVAMFYVQKISFVRLAFNPRRKYKLIYWGIGVKASQKNKFDSKGISNLLRLILIKKSDAMLFYSDYPVKKYGSLKRIAAEKLFVMNNTVEISEQITKHIQRDNIIFVGTLKKAKKIQKLLTSYFNSYKIDSLLPNLIIIGGGEDFDLTRNWIIEHNMQNKINLLGPIYNEQELEKYFKSSIACISPGQAGLTVLKSMGYGVPFITKKDAITGGEIFNIKNNVNGILYIKDCDLDEILIDISKNKEKYLKMGKEARQFYLNYRTPKHMAGGFLAAVNYVNNIKF